MNNQRERDGEQKGSDGYKTLKNGNPSIMDQESELRRKFGLVNL